MMGKWLLAGMAVLALATSAAGQAQSSRPWVNPQGESLYLLMTPQLQKELEIVPEQKERLAKISQESQARLREAYKKVAELPAEERQEKYLDVMREMGEATEKEVRDVLLPMQVHRLRQILIQTKLMQLQWGGANAFLHTELAEELQITDEQKRAFAEKEKEVREEIRRKTAEFHKQMQEEMRTKMMGVLTPEQRRQLDALTGPKYEWKFEAASRTPDQAGQGDSSGK